MKSRRSSSAEKMPGAGRPRKKSVYTESFAATDSVAATKTAAAAASRSHDLSILRQAIGTSISGFAQIAQTYEHGTEEIRKLLASECDLIFECRVCRNLFRSFASYISHKRVYCSASFCREKYAHFRQDAGYDEEGVALQQSHFDEASTQIVQLESEFAAARPTTVVGAKGGCRDLSSVIERLRRRELAKRSAAAAAASIAVAAQTRLAQAPAAVGPEQENVEVAAPESAVAPATVIIVPEEVVASVAVVAQMEEPATATAIYPIVEPEPEMEAAAPTEATAQAAAALVVLEPEPAIAPAVLSVVAEPETAKEPTASTVPQSHVESPAAEPMEVQTTDSLPKDTGIALQLDRIENTPYAVFQTLRTDVPCADTEAVSAPIPSAADSIKSAVQELHFLQKTSRVMQLNDAGKAMPVPAAIAEAIGSEMEVAVVAEAEAETEEETETMAVAVAVPRIACDNCQMTFETEETLRIHVKKNHIASTYVYPCPACSMTFLRPFAVMQHLNHIHKKPIRRLRQMRETIYRRRTRVDEIPVKGPSRELLRMQQSAAAADAQRNTAWPDNYNGIMGQTLLGSSAVDIRGGGSSAAAAADSKSRASLCRHCGRSFERRAALSTHLKICAVRLQNIEDGGGGGSLPDNDMASHAALDSFRRMLDREKTAAAYIHEHEHARLLAERQQVELEKEQRRLQPQHRAQSRSLVDYSEPLDNGSSAAVAAAVEAPVHRRKRSLVQKTVPDAFTFGVGLQFQWNDLHAMTERRPGQEQQPKPVPDLNLCTSSVPAIAIIEQQYLQNIINANSAKKSRPNPPSSSARAQNQSDTDSDLRPQLRTDGARTSDSFSAAKKPTSNPVPAEPDQPDIDVEQPHPQHQSDTINTSASSAASISSAPSSAKKSKSCPAATVDPTNAHHAADIEQRPTDCTICDKKFANLSNLRRHVAMFHYREKKFACRVCSAFRAYRKVDVLNHIASAHPAVRLASASGVAATTDDGPMAGGGWSAPDVASEYVELIEVDKNKYSEERATAVAAAVERANVRDCLEESGSGGDGAMGDRSPPPAIIIPLLVGAELDEIDFELQPMEEFTQRAPVIVANRAAAAAPTVAPSTPTAAAATTTTPASEPTAKRRGRPKGSGNKQPSGGQQTPAARKKPKNVAAALLQQTTPAPMAAFQPAAGNAPAAPTTSSHQPASQASKLVRHASSNSSSSEDTTGTRRPIRNRVKLANKDFVYDLSSLLKKETEVRHYAPILGRAQQKRKALTAASVAADTAAAVAASLRDSVTSSAAAAPIATGSKPHATGGASASAAYDGSSNNVRAQNVSKPAAASIAAPPAAAPSIAGAALAMAQLAVRAQRACFNRPPSMPTAHAILPAKIIALRRSVGSEWQVIRPSDEPPALALRQPQLAAAQSQQRRRTIAAQPQRRRQSMAAAEPQQTIGADEDVVGAFAVDWLAEKRPTPPTPSADPMVAPRRNSYNSLFDTLPERRNSLLDQYPGGGTRSAQPRQRVQASGDGGGLIAAAVGVSDEDDDVDGGSQQQPAAAAEELPTTATVEASTVMLPLLQLSKQRLTAIERIAEIRKERGRQMIVETMRRRMSVGGQRFDEDEAAAAAMD